MKRRYFLRQTALLGASGLISVGTHGLAWQGTAKASNSPRLIVIFLRGGTDGLNIVVPYQEPAYYQSRPTIAIAKPGETEGALDLDGEFGIHPALKPLMAEWKAGHLAFVHASGSPDPSRSHFQAQDYMETGTPGSAYTADGWLNRLLAFLSNRTPTQAVNIGQTPSLILTGPEAVANVAVDRQGIRPLAIERPQIQTAFDQLYASNKRLGPVYQEGRDTRDILLRELNVESIAASRGAPTPERFATSARHVAQLMSSDAATQVAFLEVGGWDTHVNERPILNRHLESLGAGLEILVQELGQTYQNTAIVVMSEFGRTVAENGNGGTDHGHGNVLWLMGGGIRGRQIYGEWPGLDPAEQHQSRDLAITTDFRGILTSLLEPHFDLSADALAQVFPDYQPQRTLRLL